MSILVGFGSYLPEKILTNDDLSKIVDTNHEWIFTRTGISKRHIAKESDSTSSIATSALKNALENAKLSSNDLDGIILATTTPDLVLPATAIRVQKNIGMYQGFAFDIQAVCSGFIYALHIANSMILTEQANTIAVIGADIMSRIIDWSDRSTCVLFGDGAGAVIIRRNHLASNYNFAAEIVASQIYSDASLIDALRTKDGICSSGRDFNLKMDGQLVFKNAVNNMTSASQKLLNKYEIKELDLIIPHQANLRILFAIADKLSIDRKKIVQT
ncbi:MAG: beta-ketoacyl-ACP synthase 3, partial [Proteobacteria bacterium]|nr:beta-ketoacyl-ACP synthase 3 [Pseudomonadota bacterium]